MSCEDYYYDWGPSVPTHEAPYRLVIKQTQNMKIVTVWDDITGLKVDEYNVYDIALHEDDDPWKETLSKNPKK